MVDRAKIIIRAGNGGNGIVHWRRERFLPKGGPDGGDGGRGGSVYVEVDKNLATLQEFAFRQKYEAENGDHGRGGVSSGAAGRDLVVKVPLGTIMHFKNQAGEVKTLDFDQDNLRVLVAKGGKGGRGNHRFRSSVNTTPHEFENGQPGESFEVELDLKLLADVGLVGFPNVGKSTLLSVITKAQPKIADYPFTTLEPNLGVMAVRDKDKITGLTIADIPGLVKGASDGKGLGDQFLRHIERTKVLVHVLGLSLQIEDVEKEVERLIESYWLIRKELGAYEGEIDKKLEMIVVNKMDLVTEEIGEKILALLKERGLEVRGISCGTLAGVEELKFKIVEFWNTQRGVNEKDLN